MANTFKIILSDDIELFLQKQAIICSPTLSKLFKENDGSFKNEITLLDMNTKAFAYVQSYLNYITTDAENSGCYIEQSIDTKTIDELIEIIISAQFLGMTKLVQIAGNKFKYLILS